MPDLLDARSLLARINPRIVALRRALSHDHDDDAGWCEHAPASRWNPARRVTPPEAQYERALLRWLAHLLHVERATGRGRIHGGFAGLDEQRAWLAAKETHLWGAVGRCVGLTDVASLVGLRAGRFSTEIPGGPG